MTRPTLPLLATLMIGSSAAFAVEIRGIEFPEGEVSFADALIDYSPGVPGPTSTRHLDPLDALGVPDATNVSTTTGSVSLGVGGSITLEFTNNLLTGSNDAGKDLHIFEVGTDVEDTFVEISRDGSVWIAVGKVFGSTSSIDIDAFGFTSSDEFRFVRLTDDPDEGEITGATVGADIDAVGAISTAPVNDSPVLTIVTAGNPAYSDALAGQGAIVHWRLNESLGSAARNSGTVGAAAEGVFGDDVDRNAESLRAGSNDSAISFPDKSSLGNIIATDFPLPGSELTVSFLVRGEDDGLSYILGYGVSGSINEFGVGSDSGEFRVVFNGSTVDIAGVDVLDGATHHVTVTWTSSTGVAQVYVDGAPAASRMFSAGTALTSGGVLALGQDLDTLTPPSYGFEASQSFVGTLDEFAVFDRVLTPGEIQAQFLAATAPAPAPISEMILEFQSALGSVYNIEDSTTLSAWGDFIPAIQGNGRKLRFVVDVTAPARFFRLE